MAVMENYVMQKESRKEKSICPNCIHHNLCIAENNQPCFECNRFIDANGVTVQEWISVTERLPDDDKLVVCLIGDTDCPEYDILRWDNADYRWDNGEEWFYHDEVTHWMPMPSTEGLK